MKKINPKEESKEKVETVDAKHIFIDIVNYTKNRSIEAQSYLITLLNQFVKEAIAKNQIELSNIIFIPTGDGMCISLINILSPYDIHIRVSLSILELIHLHNKSEKNEMRRFDLRIGINENLDNLIIDINNQKNISGSGINIAARIESLCDKKQIIVGNAVYEKLVQREKYMRSFVLFSAKVKHEYELSVYQYVDKNLEYLNNSPPSKLIIKPKEKVKISILQANFMAMCILNEDFIIKHNKLGQEPYSLRLLMFQLAEDAIEKANANKTKPSINVKVKREIEEHFKYIQSVDFWIITDLCNLLTEKYLKNISNYFVGNYLFVNKIGKDKLMKEQPDVLRKYGIS